MSTTPEPIRWHDGVLELLDQTQLPHRVVFERMASATAVRDAIRQLKVRGAPAIGIAAAYGVVVAMATAEHESVEQFNETLAHVCALIGAARPTAVNLHWAMQRMRRVATTANTNDLVLLQQALAAEAEAIHVEDRAICRAIGEYGRSLIAPGRGILTHSNAGALAVSELGTATAPLYMAHAHGTAFRVYVDETRPLLQGSRLTAWELSRGGLDVTLICDNAAAHLMAEGAIDCVIVGTDRVTANGDVINKIGTSAVAIAARHFGIPFYVACPSSTFDAATARGDDVIIEERAGEEVTRIAGTDVAAPGVKVRNPAFDVTPHTLVTGFITDRGLFRPPFDLNATFQGSRR